MNDKPTNRGGQRPGAGRKEAPETKVITTRIRLHWEPEIRAVIKAAVKRLREKDKTISPTSGK